MTLESSFDSRTGAQFIRKTFTGVGGMVACEFDFKYQCSIVACVNGMEVFREYTADDTGTYQAVEIAPTLNEFMGCFVFPALPAGLSMNLETCVISGVGC